LEQNGAAHCVSLADYRTIGQDVRRRRPLRGGDYGTSEITPANKFAGGPATRALSVCG
jgi:hypothetical protein